MDQPTLRGAVETAEPRSDIRDGTRIAWDVPIRMDDGVVLRADDPRDRPVMRHGGTPTPDFGPGQENRVLLPIVPAA